MDPFDAIVSCDSPHGLRQFIWIWHGKVIKHWDDVAIGAQSAGNFFVDPVSLLFVIFATIQSTLLNVTTWTFFNQKIKLKWSNIPGVKTRIKNLADRILWRRLLSNFPASSLSTSRKTEKFRISWNMKDDNVNNLLYTTTYVRSIAFGCVLLCRVIL